MNFSLKNRKFGACLKCIVFVGVEKQKQIDVTFLCAPRGGRFLIFLIDFIYYNIDYQVYNCNFVSQFNV